MRIKSAEFISVVVAIIACFGAVISAFYSYSNRNRELDIELIKIGISILRADPKETQTAGARAWAVEVIEKYSGQAFSLDAKKELLKDRLGYRYGFSYYDNDYSYDSSYEPLKNPPHVKK